MLTVTVALAGCGGSSPAAPTAGGARAAVHAWLQAITESRYGDACDMMTAAGRSQTGNGNAAACGPRLAAAVALIGHQALATAAARVDREPVTVSGSRATITAPDGKVTTLVFQGGRWLVD